MNVVAVQHFVDQAPGKIGVSYFAKEFEETNKPVLLKWSNF